MTQLWLPGFEPPSPFGLRFFDRLFFGLLADEEAQVQTDKTLVDLRQRFDLTSSPIDRGRRHISLFHLGDYYNGLPRWLVARARWAGDMLKAAPFETRFHHVTSFPSFKEKAPIVLAGAAGMEGVERLISFHQALGDILKQCGLGRWTPPEFLPHLTLLYDRTKIDPCLTNPVTVSAKRFVLIHSLYGRSTYRILGDWPLAFS